MSQDLSRCALCQEINEIHAMTVVELDVSGNQQPLCPGCYQ